MRPCPSGAGEPNGPPVWTWSGYYASNWSTTQCPLPPERHRPPTRPWSEPPPPDKTKVLSPRSGRPECPNSSAGLSPAQPVNWHHQAHERGIHAILVVFALRRAGDGSNLAHKFVRL